MAPTRPPSFFKIFLEPSRPYLPLPPDFVTKHLEDKIPENPILRSLSGGYSWRIDIKKVDDRYCFVDGWIKVVEDTQLIRGDFLVFWLADQSTFEVLIFTLNGCEKEFPSRMYIDLDDDDKAEEEKEEEEKVSDSESEVEEEVDDDGEEDNDHDHDHNGGGEEEDDVNNGDRDIEGDDPFFTKVISVSHKFSLRLPMKFVRVAGLDAERIITTKNLDGKEWQMNLRQGKTHDKRYYLTGWTEFRRANHLSEGDTCLFKFLRNEDKLCLAKVDNIETAVRVPVAGVLKKRRGRPPRVQPKLPACKVPAAEVSNKRPRGRPPRTVMSKEPSGKVPAAEVVLKRKRGRPWLVKVDSEDNGVTVVKRPRGRPRKIRRRGRPAHVKHL